MRTAPIPQVRSSHEVFALLACPGFACLSESKLNELRRKTFWTDTQGYWTKVQLLNFPVKSF